MFHAIRRAAAALLLATLASAPALAQAPAGPPPDDLDAFMKEVLARRDVNRATLKQYVLDEDERFAVLGPGRLAIFRRDREFAWYVRDGLHVRSPVRVDGVALGDAERDAYEREWIEEERERLERRARRAAERGEAADVPGPAEPPGPGNMPIAAPRFVSEAYFLDFKFEPGHYLLAGREDLDGHRVLRIEYYPERLFHGDPDDERERRRERDERDREQEDAIERKLNKTALITLWVDAAERQIVKYTFDNVWMDFLPGAWLARVDDVHASMEMGQPFPGVWLPRGIRVDATFAIATGPLAVEYAREFANYRLAETRSTIRVPRQQASGGAAREPIGSRAMLRRVSTRRQARPAVRTGLAAAMRTRGTTQPSFGIPSRQSVAPGGAGAAVQPDEIVREVIVHGNVTVPDAEIVRLAGLSVGDRVGPETLDAIRSRLAQSGIFSSIEVRKRYRSLTDESAVVIVLVVHERQGVSVTASGEVEKPGVATAVFKRLMFLPILGYEDGYGWTYGGSIGVHGLLGGGEQMTVPLSWGGTRQAAVEVQRTFRSGPLTFVQASAGVVQRENPRYELDDRRTGVSARIERQLPGSLRAGGGATWQTIDFAGADERLWFPAADLTLDTRGDPNFPRNAVYARAGWEGLQFRHAGGRIDRVTADGRGYLGVFRQIVLAGRVRYVGASDRLPAPERLLLGGWSSLRGERVGAFEGDRLLVSSAEIRVPVTDVMSGVKLGLLAFVDRGTVVEAGRPLADGRWHTGAGGGVFLLTPFFRVTLDVAHGTTSGDTRVHFGTGFSF